MVETQAGKATLAQVLQHTSGLPDYIKSPKFLKEFIANPKMERTPQQLIGYVANKPLDFKPGTQYGYSDTDNIVAGLVAGAASAVAGASGRNGRVIEGSSPRERWVVLGSSPGSLAAAEGAVGSH